MKVAWFLCSEDFRAHSNMLDSFARIVNQKRSEIVIINIQESKSLLSDLKNANFAFLLFSSNLVTALNFSGSKEYAKSNYLLRQGGKNHTLIPVLECARDEMCPRKGSAPFPLEARQILADFGFSGARLQVPTLIKDSEKYDESAEMQIQQWFLWWKTQKESLHDLVRLTNDGVLIKRRNINSRNQLPSRALPHVMRVIQHHHKKLLKMQAEHARIEKHIKYIFESQQNKNGVFLGSEANWDNVTRDIGAKNRSEMDKLQMLMSTIEFQAKEFLSGSCLQNSFDIAVQKSQCECGSHRMRIMLLGAFSSGKTTLINSLFFNGQRALRTARQPNTAAIIRLLPCKTESEQRVRVVYLAKDESSSFEILGVQNENEELRADFTKDTQKFLRLICEEDPSLIDWTKTQLYGNRFTHSMRGKVGVELFEMTGSQARKYIAKELLDPRVNLARLRKQFLNISLRYFINSGHERFSEKRSVFALVTDEDWGRFQGTSGSTERGLAEELYITWFSKEIQVHICNALLDYFELIDSPGLGSSSPSHDRLTSQSIRVADWWIVVLKVLGNSAAIGLSESVKKVAEEIKRRPHGSANFSICLNHDKQMNRDRKKKALEQAKKLDEDIRKYAADTAIIKEAQTFCFDFLNSPTSEEFYGTGIVFPSVQVLLQLLNRRVALIIEIRKSLFLSNLSSWCSEEEKSRMMVLSGGLSAVDTVFELRRKDALAQLARQRQSIVDAFEARMRSLVGADSYYARDCLPENGCDKEDLARYKRNMLALADEYIAERNKFVEEAICSVKQLTDKWKKSVPTLGISLKELKNGLESMPEFSDSHIRTVFKSAEDAWSYGRGIFLAPFWGDSNGEVRRKEILLAMEPKPADLRSWQESELTLLLSANGPVFLGVFDTIQRAESDFDSRQKRLREDFEKEYESAKNEMTKISHVKELISMAAGK